MSVTDELEASTGDRAEPWLRRTRFNIARWGALLVRSPRGRAKLPWRRPRVAAWTAAATLALLALMVFVDGHTVALSGRLSPWLRTALDEITDFGKSGWFLIPLGLTLVFIAARYSAALPRVTRLLTLSVAARLSFLFAAIAAPSLFATIVKRFIGRARPYLDLAGDPFHYQPFVWRPDFASMPSGHATTAVAAATAIGLIWPRLRAPIWGYALVIMASRVLLAVHYPSDVLAGAVVGAVGAVMVRDWFAARRLGFAIDPQGRVVPLPGPSIRRVKRVARALLAP